MKTKLMKNWMSKWSKPGHMSTIGGIEKGSKWKTKSFIEINEGNEN